MRDPVERALRKNERSPAPALIAIFVLLIFVVWFNVSRGPGGGNDAPSEQGQARQEQAQQQTQA